MNDQSKLQSMNSSRRRFVRTAGVLGIAGVGTVGFSGSAAGKHEKIRGRIQKPNNRPAATEGVVVLGREPFFGDEVLTDERGFFEANANRDSSQVAVGYYESVGDNLEKTSVKNGSPDLFMSQVMKARPNVGTIKLPDAHLLDVRVEDGDGNPATNVRVRCVDIREFEDTFVFIGTSQEPVNDSGQFQYTNADEPGIELAGKVRVEVWDDTGGGTLIGSKMFDLTADRTVTFEV